MREDEIPNCVGGLLRHVNKIKRGSEDLGSERILGTASALGAQKPRSAKPVPLQHREAVLWL